MNNVDAITVLTISETRSIVEWDNVNMLQSYQRYQPNHPG